jgi:hypothetical protein
MAVSEKKSENIRQRRQERMSKIKAVAEEKQRERDGDAAASSESNAPSTTS